MAPSTRNALGPFLILFAALYAGFGVQSPYLTTASPSFAGARREIGPGAAGLLWSESVAAEVVVFFIVGRPLLDRLGPAGAAALAATAGMVRWSLEAQTA
jgi:hypothetical protein